MEDYQAYIDQFMVSINRIDGLYYMAARKLGIKENMLALLYALDDGRAHSQKQISEEWLIPKTTINTIVKECLEKNYMVLTNGAHTREKYIALTESGRAYAARILGSTYRAEQKAMERIIQECSPEFIRVLEQFSHYLDQEFEKEKLK